MSPGRVLLAFGRVTVPAEVTGSVDRTTVRVGDVVVTLTLTPLEAGVYAVTCDGRRTLAHYASDGRMHYLHVDGQTYAFERDPADERRRSPASGHYDLRAPMPGVVTQVFVQEGQAVATGAPLYVVEAMKMETVIRASSPCRVERILIAPGTQVEGGAVVVEVKHLEA
ncbi:MAG: biotin/lipoyl-containing protein [Armatimonadota bacterium]